MTKQLSPGFLDRMPACSGRDVVIPAELAVASAGSVNAKGDCEWKSGVKCHFHRGAEFVDSSAHRPEVGELHCVVPTSDPKTPNVYGTHFVCKTGSEVSQDLLYHQPCGVMLLATLAQMMTSCDARCCDAGTLTEPAAEREKAGELDVRPDFRMCATTQQLDCNVMAGMVGREANAPAFGAPIDDGV